GYLPPMDPEKLKALFEIENAFKAGQLSADEARLQIKERVGKVSAYHVAYIEQTMTEETSDECIREDVHAVINMLGDQIDNSMPNLPADHPIMHYLKENEEMKRLLLAVEDLVQYPMIKNQWLELYDKISQYPIHYKRKQNQLYPMLERKGFTRPTTTMWTFDDMVRDEIREAERLLREDQEEAFIKQQERVLLYARDLMEKEEFILYPTSMALISEEEFEDMKSGDQEIGFAFFEVEHKTTENKVEIQPKEQNNFANDLQALLTRYGYSAGGGDKLDVTTGKLTLEQVNLIYKHLPIDISFVDENELVCFYSDTDHRIFPRSKNVIGREVMNCHPRKSAHIVREVIDKLRSGEQDKAEFWINKPGLFIYIIYVAVRDKDGNFRGVLEMMQDCTHIRALEGSQTLLTWSNGDTSATAEQSHDTQTTPAENDDDEEATEPVTEITSQTRLKDLLKQYPTLKSRLPELDPKFKMLNTPLGKIMMGKANVQTMSERSGIPLDKLIEGIKKLIN
ncbi:MAG: PAS domain-containing protein, partial [Prevotella sp.]